MRMLLVLSHARLITNGRFVPLCSERLHTADRRAEPRSDRTEEARLVLCYVHASRGAGKCLGTLFRRHLVFITVFSFVKYIL
jgi:hypothetical protein